MPRRCLMPFEKAPTFFVASSSRPDGLEELVDFRPRDPVGQAVEPCHKAQVLSCVHLVVKSDVLRQIAYLFLYPQRVSGRIEAADRARPEVGSVRPRSMRMVVVLPAPLGPRNPKISPSVDPEGDAVDRCLRAVHFRKAIGFDDGPSFQISASPAR